MDKYFNKQRQIDENTPIEQRIFNGCVSFAATVVVVFGICIICAVLASCSSQRLTTAHHAQSACSDTLVSANHVAVFTESTGELNIVSTHSGTSTEQTFDQADEMEEVHEHIVTVEDSCGNKTTTEDRVIRRKRSNVSASNNVAEHHDSISENMSSITATDSLLDDTLFVSHAEDAIEDSVYNDKKRDTLGGSSFWSDVRTCISLVAMILGVFCVVLHIQKKK